MSSQSYFEPFRLRTIGHDATITTALGTLPLIYADWTASGRLYRDIEHTLSEEIGPYVANTHSESSTTGRLMTRAYHHALDIVRRHVGAGEDDVVLGCGTGATGAINKLQRLLGLRVNERWQAKLRLAPTDRPVVFVTHMEHHSNHVPWLESLADVVVVPPDQHGLVSPDCVEQSVREYADRPLLIGSFTACSNVTGIRTPYHRLAQVMHRHGGLCFVDFAACAPYEQIVMHPPEPDASLDAIFFSPHKFLGGPGSCGILVFNGRLDSNRVPDEPGGGTVNWTNPWGGRSYIADVAMREDGGTPGFLQMIRAALALQLKERMDPLQIHARERAITGVALNSLRATEHVHVLAPHVEDRLGIISFYFDHLHFNLGVSLLNDRYGIQVRGGCSCAGTYGHYLLGIDEDTSARITAQIDGGNLADKPGWIRVSLHPTTTDEEVATIVRAIAEIADAGPELARDYVYDPLSNEFEHARLQAALVGRDRTPARAQYWRSWFGD